MSLKFPEKLKVGFQKRGDTYNGNLAFITYFNLDNTVKSEGTFNKWSDDNIPMVEHDNKPQKGYVLNKGIQRYSSFGGNTQKIRIYDPRGFEFEITVDNLIELTQYSDINSQEINQECVLAWNGNQVYLVPTNSKNYQEILSFQKLNSTEVKLFSKKDTLEVGHTYATKSMPYLYYLGKVDGSDVFFNDDFRLKKVSKSSIIAKISSTFKENHNELVRIMNFLSALDVKNSVFYEKEIKPNLKAIKVDGILDFLKVGLDRFDGVEPSGIRSNEHRERMLMNYMQAQNYYNSHYKINGIEINKFLANHKDDCMKLSEDYNEQTKEIFFEKLRKSLMGSKITIITPSFADGYYAVKIGNMYYPTIKDDDFESFLNSNKNIYFSSEMFVNES